MPQSITKLRIGERCHAHCKSAQGPFICGYIGKGEVFAEAICKFAAAYADQTEKDYDDFMGMPVGTKYEMNAMEVSKFNSDGKATDHWEFMEPAEMMKMMQQQNTGGMKMDTTKHK